GSPCPKTSIADGEPLPDMLRFLQFVDGGDRVVLERDAAALVVAQQLILAEAELAGAFAGNEHRRGREERPVEVVLMAQEVEKLAAPAGLRLIGRRELRRVDQP